MIGIIGAMEIEVKTLKAMLEEPKTETVSGVEFVSGTLCGREVVVAACGIGKVFAAIAAEAMILKYAPEIIINSGVGGALDKKLKIADIVIADFVVQHDMDTTAFKDPPGFLSGINIVNIPAAEYVNTALTKSADAAGITHYSGIVASGDEFVDSIARKKEIADTFGAAVCEMEGASIGHVCYVNNVDFAVIRSVSDTLDDNSNMEYSEFAAVAAANSIKVIAGFIENYEPKKH